MARLFLMATLLMSGFMAYSLPNSETYFTINPSSVKIKEVNSGTLTQAELKELIGDCSKEDTSEKTNPDELDIGTIINYGKQLWQIVVDNRPVVNVKEYSANALPRGVKCWTDLELWKAPRYKTYQVTYENMMGMSVVDFEFQLFYSYGGKVNGVGSYLANVAVTPMNLDVLWGFTFDATVEVGNVLNIGTKDDPTAGIEMAMKWNAKSPLNDSRGQIRYFVQGDGKAEFFE
ncbi:MAG: hypothetical protein KDD34_02150 [Bdellovibrionales bacterium]|nr:hypothetical protein [Bdellovibrionales bacterium]